ncbi:MerR family transcriptional regulator [Rhodoferax koreense]|uniref:MerR family transcriptional regulator n=1 Tax=Rhodoferax koreensis TaxID=1842727 RepID=A0A1P8JQM4_9BURK|nr:MerR family transcriptional regulator [Rhodoferax koreense]APW36064.1 MerR family transcriptional regulator [Rhodoferax koreense]
MRCILISTNRFLSPSEAAKRLGVSAKALRIYEQRGLITPARNPAGWRSYGPNEMARGAEIVALRALGLSLAEVARVIEGDVRALVPSLAAHQAALENQVGQLIGTIEKVRRVRADLDRGQTPIAAELTYLLAATATHPVEFELPWPWGGELFSLPEIKPLNYIVGPLGSGKTRLALRLAEVLPGAAFLGLDRLKADTTLQLADDSGLRSRVDQALTWLLEDGASSSEALIALIAGIEADGQTILVIDMVEQGLDQGTQEAVIAFLRRRRTSGKPLFLMTRSCAILDLATVDADETIIFCPANHSPPALVAAHPGSPGYEAVATCLASPEVRARTQGMVAWRPKGEAQACA